MTRKDFNVNMETFVMLPKEVKDAFANLREKCLIHNVPKDLIYDGIAWDVHHVVSQRAAKLLLGW